MPLICTSNSIEHSLAQKWRVIRTLHAALRNAAHNAGDNDTCKEDYMESTLQNTHGGAQLSRQLAEHNREMMGHYVIRNACILRWI